MLSNKEKVRPNLFQILPYTPGKPIEEVQRELGISDIIKMASNENLLGASPKATRAVADALINANYYPDAAHYVLKNKLAARLGVKPENIIVGNGSDELIKLIAETFIKEGDEAVMATPSFSEYDFAVKLMGGRMIQVPVRPDFRLDLDAMARAITPRTKLVFLCNPNNPTGTMVLRDEVEEFLRKVPDEVIVIFDQAYYEYVDHPEYPNGLDYIKAGRNAIALHTFSKVYGLAGLRVGYGLASEELIQYISLTREPFNVNAMGQIAAVAALDDQEHVLHSRKVNREGKEYLYKALEEMGLSYVPTETNFMLVNVVKDSRKVFAEMLKEGVIVRTGDIFGLPGYIRVTIGLPEHNERFIKALKAALSRVEA